MKRRPKAITLIEILITIAIFSVGILTISYLIINNISLSQRTKLKTTATMLAKEGIELAYHRRDTNIKKGRLRNCLKLKEGSYAGECQTYFHNPGDLNGSTTRKLEVNDQGTYSYSAINSQNDLRLYRIKSPNGDYYKYVTFGVNAGNTVIGQTDLISPYKRAIIFSPAYLSPEGGNQHPDKLLKVTSIVRYKQGSISGSVSLQSFIGDTLDTIPLDEY